jgi:diguanylate cyclase (GGDEF)-like protein/PAS domain S-box-containing protein
MITDNTLLKEILENLYDGVYFVDRQRKITYWNQGAQRLSGFSSQEALGKRCSANLLRHIDQNSTNLCENGCPLAQTLVDGQSREAEVFLHHKDGHRVPVLVRVAPVRDAEGEIIGAVEIFNDSTQLVAYREWIEDLRRAAFIDPLTGLVNRRGIQSELARAVLQAHEQENDCFGILFADIDYFKDTNDRYGHPVGDRVLKMVANSIRNGLRSCDVSGRWGGEEFVSILQQVDASQLALAAERVRMLVASSWISLDDGAMVNATISIGAALSRLGEDPEALVERADRLMYRSKAEGRNRVTIESP